MSGPRLFPGNNTKTPGTPGTATGLEEMVGHVTCWESERCWYLDCFWPLRAVVSILNFLLSLIYSLLALLSYFLTFSLGFPFHFANF